VTENDLLFCKSIHRSTDPMHDIEEGRVSIASLSQRFRILGQHLKIAKGRAFPIAGSHINLIFECDTSLVIAKSCRRSAEDLYGIG